MSTDSIDALPLTPAVFLILLALSGGERHGYGIIQDVEQLTDGQLRLSPGTLYGAINRMLQSSWIEESATRRPQEDERRRYYRLTDLGRRVARAEAERLARLVQVARTKDLLDPLPGQS